MSSPTVEYHREQNKLIQEGYLSTQMLFGYINAIRKMFDLKPYTNLCSMTQALSRHRFQPRIHCMGNSKRYRNWWKTDEVVPVLCEIRQRDQIAFLSKTATEKELNSGEWQDVIITSRLTGISRKRVSSLGSHNKGLTRVHPYTQARLFHVPSIREKGYYRSSSFVRKVMGDETTDALLKTRPTKTVDFEQHNIRYIYTPELAHL